MPAKPPLTEAHLKSALTPEAREMDRTHGAPIEVERALGIIGSKLLLLPQTEDLLACWHVVQLAAMDSTITKVAYPNVKALPVLVKR